MATKGKSNQSRSAALNLRVKPSQRGAKLDRQALELVSNGGAMWSEVLALGAEEIESLWEAATALHVAGSFERALAVAEGLIVLGGERSDVLLLQATCLDRLGRPSEARRSYERALAITPESLRDEVLALGSAWGGSLSPAKRGE